jgi:hypothetical protein
MPPQRAAAVLDAEQQKKLEADLVAIRNRQSRQQKNAASEKAKAAKATKPDSGKSKRGNSPQKPAAPQSGTAGRAVSGAPPWPLPPQTTGGSPRP